MELPNDATIGVIASEQQTILEVVQPILRHHDIDLDNYSIVLVSWICLNICHT